MSEKQNEPNHLDLSEDEFYYQATRQTPEGDADLFFEKQQKTRGNETAKVSNRPVFKNNDFKKAAMNGARVIRKKFKESIPPEEYGTLRKHLPIIAAMLAGMLIGIWVSMYALPGTPMFKSSSLGRFITESANSAAKEASSGVYNNLSEQLSAVENQKQVISESSDQPNMTVSEIVKQYRSSVVTVVAKLKGLDEWGEQRNFIGSGFILNGDGMIATNHHVIAGADELSVILSNGNEYKVHEINSDEDSDLTILKLDKKIQLPGIVTVGDSDNITVGEQVVAIGSPVSRNFAGTVTSGIISGKDREVVIDGSSIKYLQTDAAINEGNSGGPLFNSRGEVIGINTAKMSENVQGIGFAIPINILKGKLDYLSKVPLYTGFTAKDLNPAAYEALNIKNGLVVLEVEKNSPAAKAGIETNDIILKFDLEEISTTSRMNELRENHKAGDTILLTIKRGNFTFDVTLTLIKRP